MDYMIYTLYVVAELHFDTLFNREARGFEGANLIEQEHLNRIKIEADSLLIPRESVNVCYLLYRQWFLQLNSEFDRRLILISLK